MPAKTRLPSELVRQAQVAISELKAIRQTREERQRIASSLVGFTESLGYHNTWFHNEWYGLYGSFKSFYLEAPRGHAKSTCGAVNFPLWRILLDPDVNILIISGVIADARRLVGEILLRIEQSYPWLKAGATKWTESEAYVARPMISKDPTLRSSGILGVKPGPRADLIILDDVVNEENSSSELLRNKVIMKIRKVVIPMLKPGGQLVVNGTPYHYADFYQIYKDENWGPVYHYEAIQKDGSALWPERWPIDCKRRITLAPSGLEVHPGQCCLNWFLEVMGTAVFNCQLLCDPRGLVGRMMKEEWLQPYYQMPVPADLEVVAGVDLAFSKESAADYTAIVTVGWSQTTNTMYILDADHRRVSLPEQFDFLMEKYNMFRPQPDQPSKITRIIMESNALQGLLVVRPMMRETNLPILPRKSLRDKVGRILAMTPYFETKKLVARRDQHNFISEYVQFEPGSEAHDDILDALELAVSDIVGRHITKAGEWKGSGLTFKKKGDWHWPGQ